MQLRLPAARHRPPQQCILHGGIACIPRGLCYWWWQACLTSLACVIIRHPVGSKLSLEPIVQAAAASHNRLQQPQATQASLILRRPGHCRQAPRRLAGAVWDATGHVERLKTGNRLLLAALLWAGTAAVHCRVAPSQTGRKQQRMRQEHTCAWLPSHSAPAQSLRHGRLHLSLCSPATSYCEGCS